jgi:hypothetical protein
MNTTLRAEYNHHRTHADGIRELPSRMRYVQEHIVPLIPALNAERAAELDMEADRAFTLFGRPIIKAWQTRWQTLPDGTRQKVRRRLTPEECDAAEKQGREIAHKWLRQNTIDRREIGDCYLLPDGSVKPWSSKRKALTTEQKAEFNYTEDWV